jgi:pyruvate dehydrogenase E1 component alpha subunit
MICQNNQWAISVPLHKQSASRDDRAKADAYGMPAVRVDGNDVLAVYVATREASRAGAAGEGPTFVELVTYRRLGHSSSSDDPTKYRDEAEVAEWEQRDPVDRYRAFLERAGLWDDAQDEELKDRISGEINMAIKQAEDAPQLAPESVYADVFATPDPRTAEDVRDALDAFGS